MFTDGTSRFSSTTADPGDEMNASEEPERAASNPLDDVFGDDSDDDHRLHAQGRITNDNVQTRSPDVSDVPRLQGIHTTNGYRDGIAVSKEKFLQEGFDEGYSLGAEVGAAAGRLIGVLEGLAVAVRSDEASEVLSKLESARKELSAKSLYASDFFGEDGIWKFSVGKGGDDEADLTFRVVAAAHPLVVKWTGIVDELVENHGLQLTIL
jgi:hypothetical protein